MKTISVPVQTEFLNNLLEEALREEILLETAGGQRFVLVSVEGWQGFEINEEDDITENRELMAHLADRRSMGQRIPISEVRKRLGI